ncbi:MAG: permease [Candidatus Dechloromonas phosphoritropha]|nr:permease [Candidatus Dechloromonas phosphoritropha]MBP8788513.1 permease [Azonexus sp.]MBP9228976.1 permease [Azonexus sp.]
MTRKTNPPRAGYRAMAAGAALIGLQLLVAGCGLMPAAPPPSTPATSPPAAVSEDGDPLSALAYYHSLQRMTPTQITRERQVLAASTPTPNTQVRIAMALGYPRGQDDLARALILLEAVLKSTDPAAVSLQPLARLLADNYGERHKLEGQLEKQSQQLKESQRKAVELQEKIDGLADIERTLPQRPRATRPAGVVR